MDQNECYGSLCSGIGGLDLAVESVFGFHPAWHSEINPDALAVHDHHWPGVPNLGDLTAVEWESAPSVDLICAGYPCQPFSHAGARRGEEDERHLWPHIAEAVRVLRPRWVVLENVAGHLSLGFGAVLGDLAEAGYDAEWCCLRAADIGAPHRRERVFVVAADAERRGRAWRAPEQGRGTLERAAAGGGGEDAPADPTGDTGRFGDGDGGAPAHSGRERFQGVGPDDDRDGGGKLSDPARCDQAPSDAECSGQRAGTGLRPDGEAGVGRGRSGDDVGEVEWGPYAPVIRRWERVLRRCAPDPVDGRGRLAPQFVEWMMGYPAGWVDGLTRTAALRCLGNAVVPQQGIAALSVVLDAWEAAA